MAEIKDSKLIRDALGSPVPQYWDETSQMYVARTVDGSFADVDFEKVRLLRDKLGSPIPQLWDTETARFVPGKGGGNGEVTIESVPGLKEKLDTTTAQLAETENKIAAKANGRDLTPKVEIPLDLPTYDGNKSTVHPSVVLAPDGWNGYRYWMAYTPWPGDPRENPHVAASTDGITWVVPDGLVNPVVPISEIQDQGYVYNSDTHLILRQDNVMVMYYRTVSGTKETIWHKTSTDGVTWSPAVELITTTHTGYPGEILSPAVAQEANGSFVMWTIKRANDTVDGVVERRTSTDGLSWSVPTACSLPAVLVLPSMVIGVRWHLDVKKVSNEYHMLLCGRDWRLYYYRSADGVTWTGDRSPAVALSGMSFDVNGHYRSAFLPVAGNPLKWDIWVTGRPANTSQDAWRVGLYRNVELPMANLKANLAIGEGATAQGVTRSVAFGHQSYASGDEAGAFGVRSRAEADYSTAFGSLSKASQAGATAIGRQAEATGGTGATAVGRQSLASGATSTAIGWLSKATGVDSVGIGREANATGNNATAIGDRAIASHLNSVALGSRSTTTQESQVQIKDRHIEFAELPTDPAAPALNGARLYTKDNGSGKTQLCVRFNTGAVFVLATEP